jgi:hypothetical protein
MNTVTNLTPIVNADEWNAAQVGEFAANALRAPGGIAHMCNGLRVSSYRPWMGNARKVNSRIWVIEDEQGAVLSEEPSLYRAIHSLAR